MLNNSKQNLSVLSINLARGGAQKVISLILKKLIEDYNVTLVFFYENIHFPIPKEVKVVYLSKQGANKAVYFKIFDSIRFIYQYNRFLKKENIKTSISFLAFPNLINGIIGRFNKSVETIISERGFPSRNDTSKLSLNAMKLFYPIFYNNCHKLFSNSTHINNDLRTNFGIRIPMEVIYNPIEIPQNKIDSSSLNNKNLSLKIITAGTLNPNKNQIMIIKAMLETKSNDTLIILGDGNSRSLLDREIVKQNLQNRVILKGSVKNVNQYFIESDCFVLSSFNEGFPNALLEAMAIGLPCISTNCLSGPLELLNENRKVEINNGEYYIAKYGILINNDDHVGLSRGLEFLRNNPAMREKFSALSLMRSDNYSLDNVYKQLHKFIQN